MRLTSLLVLAASAGAAATTASAQGEARVRVAEPSIASGNYRVSSELAHRAALGIGTTATGTLRDTLGLMITSVTRGSPAERAGLEEGNRIAAINGVSLRVNAADVEDGEMSNALTRRLTRELGKSKPGDEVELRIYRDGRTQSVKVKTADSDVLFGRTDAVRISRSDLENRPALGFGLGSTGSRRDTLGVLVMSVADSTPAAKAGLEEGNRIAAINGVNLRVAREDAGDRWLGNTKAQRLQREIAALKPGDNVTLKVYANGQFRDVSMKVARMGDLPRSGAMMFMGDGFDGMAPAMPMMRMVPMTPMTPMPSMPGMGRMRLDMTPELRRSLEGARMQLEHLGPQLQRSLEPGLQRLRMELPRAMEQLRQSPFVRMRTIIV